MPQTKSITSSGERRGITDDSYDRFYQSFNEKKMELETRLSLLSKAEDNYYITAKYLLELANRAYDLFINSEVEERRQLLKLILSNLGVDDSLVKFDALKPFDTILKYNDCQLELPLVEYVRNYYLDCSSTRVR